jgi:RimJ/RimL family protein N-acetyltransferase
MRRARVRLGLGEGLMRLRTIDTEGREAEIVFSALPSAPELEALVAQAFGEGIERLELRCAKDDPARTRLGLACGFGIEGVRRGVAHDTVVLVRLATDPAGPLPRVLPDFPGERLTDGVITLRRLEPSDVDEYFALESVPDVARYRFGGAMTAEGARMRCDTAEYRWLAGEMAQCVITAGGGFTGTIQLVNREPGTMMLGYSLAPASRGKGYATRAVNLLTEWAFAIGAVRVIAGTFPENELSRAVLQRAGFALEAVFRAALPGPDGTRIDNIQLLRLRHT